MNVGSILLLCLLVIVQNSVFSEKHAHCEHGHTTSSGDCVCDAHYEGPRCEHVKCENGGTAEGHHHHCHCTSDWKGTYCEHLCYDGLCLNGGHCFYDSTHFYCLCPHGYTGQRCQDKEVVTPAPVVHTPCDSSPCSHGGTCYHTEKSYTCACRYPYTGSTCTSVDICATNHCQNGGSCHQEGHSYVCHCPPNYSGTRCETCASHPCRNGGTCLADGSSYYCHCSSSFSGHHCEVHNVCANHHCKNGGTCHPEGQSYICHCPSPYIGKDCSACHNSPCVNGGTCYHDNNNVFCHCPPGYTGLICQDKIVPSTVAPYITGCSSSPCKNGGHCYSDGMLHYCVCQRGFDGHLCENVITTTTTTTTSKPVSTGPVLSITLAPGATLFPPMGTITPKPTLPPAKLCDATLIIRAFAFGLRASSADAGKCPGSTNNTADAVLLNYCHSPGPDQFKQLERVSESCLKIKEFTAVAQFHHGTPTAQMGVFLNCNGTDSFEFVTQDCTKGMHSKHISWPESETFYTVDWVKTT